MKAYTAAALLAASASAHSIHQRHIDFHARRDTPAAYTPAPIAPAANATCGCSTYVTTWYGNATLVQPPPPPTTSSEAPPPPTSTYVAPVTTSTSSSSTTSSSSSSSSSSSEEAGPTVYAAQAAPPSPSAPAASAPSGYSGGNSGGSNGGSSGGSGSIAPNGNQWAMTYTPYASDGSCKSASDVASDISSIKDKGFTTVRMYATDCDGVPNIGSAAKAVGMKLIMGIFIESSGIGSATDEQLGDITSWGSQGNWDIVEMVVVGNEAIFNNYVSASQLASYIGQVKGQLSSAGYSGPVTTTEPYPTMLSNAGTLCSAIDVVAANIHPFFDTDCSASGAGAFVSNMIGQISAACGGQKQAYCLETGWPSATTISGLISGIAIPGTSEQQTAIDGILAQAGQRSAIFSFQDDMWKSPGPMGVEQFWGASQLFSG